MPKQRKAPRNTFWRGRTLWGRLKIKGRDIKWSLRTDDSKTAVARIEAERKRLIAAAHYGDDRKLMDHVLAAWGEHYITHQVAESTRRRYAVSLAQLRPWLEGRHLDEVDKAVIGQIVEARRGQGAGTATIRRDLTALSSVLEYAIAEEWRPEDDNPALSRLRRLKERRDPIVLPEPADIRRVIQRCPGALGAMVEAAWRTGCRQSELVTAQRLRLDHSRRQLTVRGKGNKVRVIDLDAATYELLRSLPVRLGCKWLFWHGDGSPYRNVASRFRAIVAGERIAAQAARRDFRAFRFHDLRHLYAVDWLKAGGSIYTLSKHLGHSSVKVTEIYLSFLTPGEGEAAKAGDGMRLLGSGS